MVITMAISKRDFSNPEPYLTPTQVADLIRVSPVTVRSWSLNGRLKFKTTPGGHRRYKLSDVEEFARENNVDIKSDSSLRILIVDDNDGWCDALIFMLSVYDVEVEVAKNGFEAGEKIHSFKPDVVLMDLIMPGLNGFEACKRIKENTLTKDIRVIGMTGFYSEENIQDILAAGAEQCLAKPIKESVLIEALGLELFEANRPS